MAHSHAAELLCRSAEGERKHFDTRIGKLDLELSISDGLHLPDQLIHPWLGDRSVAFVVHVNSMSSTGGSPSISTRNRTELPGTDTDHNHLSRAVDSQLKESTFDEATVSCQFNQVLRLALVAYWSRTQIRFFVAN